MPSKKKSIDIQIQRGSSCQFVWLLKLDERLQKYFKLYLLPMFGKVILSCWVISVFRVGPLHSSATNACWGLPAELPGMHDPCFELHDILSIIDI